MKPGNLVSIITPAYNAAPYLRETISSVIRQTHEDWEWIISDDGSEDETVGIVLEAAKSDSRIRLILPGEETGLAARARNRALEEARGDFMAFLDADDLWEPEKTERQVSYLMEHPEADAVCCLHDHFGHVKSVKLEDETTNHGIYKTRVCRRKDLIKQLPFQTSTLMMRRKCYATIGGMDEDSRLRSGQDFEYFARLIASFNVHRIHEIMVHYRLAPEKKSIQAINLAYMINPDWSVFEVMMEKGFYSPEEARKKRSSLYYDQAVCNLYHFDAPFRRYLIKSVLSGRPPLRAVVALSLSFLSAPMLRKTLVSILGVVNRLSMRESEL